MKTPSSILLITAVAFCLSVSCTRRVYHTGKPLPPGQAKKLTGSKSAKPYAPGQQKKKH